MSLAIATLSDYLTRKEERLSHGLRESDSIRLPGSQPTDTVQTLFHSHKLVVRSVLP